MPWNINMKNTIHSRLSLSKVRFTPFTFIVALIVACLFSGFSSFAQSGNIYTMAGTGTAGFSGDGGPATAARLNNPTDVFKDAAGNFYIADRDNNRIRKVNTAGTITTIAGTGAAGYTGDGGSALLAKLRHPNGVAVDAAGNIYIADQGNDVIRKINTSGIISTIAGTGTAGFTGDGGLATLARLDDPEAVAVDISGNIYIADNNNSRIRKINTSGIISTYAGGGGTGFTVGGVPATSVSLCNMRDVSVDNGGTVYFTNQGCWHILKITPAGLLYNVAGHEAASYSGDCGPADSADIEGPYGVYPDNTGNVYICPRGNIRVRKVNTLNYIVTVAGQGVAGYTGDGGPALSATVSAQIQGIYADPTGNVYFADAGNEVIRTFTSSDFSDTTSLPICAGGVDTLHDTVGYGVWTSSNTSVAIIGSSTGILTGVSAGSAVITYTNASCPALFLVNVTESAIATPTGGIVCIGATVTATDTAAGGTWSSSDLSVAAIGSTTGIITGIAAGTSNITYLLPSGCYATTVVTVNPLPTAILGTLTVCAGLTTTLGDALAGGTWSSGSTATATVGALTGIVTGGAVLTTSTATITYTSAAGCVVTADVTVNPSPSAILGTLTVCTGLTTSLTDATTGGTWSSTGTASVSPSGMVTGVSPGTATITYALTATGCITKAIVTVNALPTAILGTMELCAGTTTTLSDLAAGGTWISGATATATVGSATGIVTGGAVTTASTATITYTLGTGCTVTAVVTVDPLPTPILGTLSVCAGQTTTLSDAGAGTWSSSATGVATVGLSSGIVTGGAVAVTSTATITYTLGTGCFTTAVVTLQAAPTAVLGTRTVCSGLTTTLSVADAGGTWATSNVTIATVDAIGVVTGGAVAVTSTATITYSLGIGCVATAIVTVYPAPAAITGSLVLCGNSTGALTDAVTGGTWLSSSPSDAAVGLSTGTLTTGGVLVLTTVTITYTLASGCVTTTIVTVNPRPDVITGTLNICVGSTFALSDATAGGTWSSSNVGVGSVSVGGAVTGVSTGTAAISYTLPTGCFRAAIVTVDPLPGVITGTRTVCAGATTALSDGPAGGTWSSNNVAIATVASLTGIVTGQGVVVVSTATISYIIGAAGCYVTAVVTVNPLPFAISGNHFVCLGATTTLSDPTAGGTWSSASSGIASVSATGVVTGNSAGVTTITYQLATGCYVTVPMTVNALPGAITGPNNVCPGASITLSDATPGGTWSSSNTGIATVGSLTGVVTGVAGGVVNIIYTSGAGCSGSYTITVNALPVPVITPLGDTTYCPGGFVVLTANTGAGYTYQWYLGGTPLPGATASTYAVTTTGGAYQVRETNASGCAALSIPMLVTIDVPVADITTAGSTTICASTIVTLNANTGIGFSYQWLQGGVVIPGAITSDYSTSVAGDYAVIVTNATGCSATSSIVTVSVNTLPVANIVLSGPLSFCAGGNVTMTADYNADYSYQWYNAAGAISGAIGQSYTATTTNGYYVIVTNSFGCVATSVIVNVIENALPDVAITAGGPTLFCAGGSVTLNASAIPGGLYQWYHDGSPITGATSSAYLATVSGGYRVKVTNTTTGCSAVTLADTMVTVVATPVIVPLSPSSFCWGGSSLLSTSVSGAAGAVTYQWLLNGVLIPGATSGLYNAAIAGNYSVQISIPGSCTLTTLDVPVTEYPLPDPTVYFTGTLFYTASYYVTYQWYKDAVVIAGATAMSTPSTGSGDYKVAVTDTNGCQSFSNAYPYTGGSTTAVTSVDTRGVDIYPSPADNEIFITMDAGAYASFVITNNLGQQVMQQPVIKTETKVNVETLPAGLYYITFRGNNGTEVKKFVKM